MATPFETARLADALRGDSSLSSLLAADPFHVAGRSVLSTPIPVGPKVKPLEALLLGLGRGAAGGLLTGIGGARAKEDLGVAQAAIRAAEERRREAERVQQLSDLNEQRKFQKDLVTFQTDEAIRQAKATNPKLQTGATSSASGVLGKVGSKLTEKELTSAAENADKGQALISIGERVLPVVDQAGHTGLGSGIAGTLLKAESALGSDIATEALKNRAVLESVAPEVIASARAAGSGAMSDFESRLYAASGPSTSKTPEENRRLAHTLIERGKRTVEFNDFLRTWVQARGATTGARNAWIQYEKQFPIDSPKNMAKNPRPDWRDYFSGQSTTKAPRPNPADFNNAKDFVAAVRAWEKRQ